MKIILGILAVAVLIFLGRVLVGFCRNPLGLSDKDTRDNE